MVYRDINDVWFLHQCLMSDDDDEDMLGDSDEILGDDVVVSISR